MRSRREARPHPPITIRRLALTFPNSGDPIIIPDLPEESFLYVGLSLLLPHLEPYLIRSMSAAKKHIHDGELLSDIDGFNGQESQHYRAHVQFNKSLNLAKYPGWEALEEALAADYRRFTEARSLRFNLAYAEGFEAFTMAMTRFAFQTGALDRVPAATRTLFRWHLVEELEHRTVAFDVYQHLFGDYFYRLAIGLYAQWHLCRFVVNVTRNLMRADRDRFRALYGGPWRSCWRLCPLISDVLLYLLPKVMATYLPWYSPHRVAIPPFVQDVLNEYTQRARSSRGPNEGRP